MSFINSVSLSKTFAVLQVDRLLAVLAGMFFFPTILHALPVFEPGSGMIWLPIFYAPLVAVMYCRPHVGLIAALIAPSLNSLFTGLPERPMVWMLTVDLLLFIAIAQILHRIFKRLPLTGACSYIVTKFIAVVIVGIMPAFLTDLNRIAAFGKIIAGAGPGLVMLLLINWAVLMKKKGPAHG